MSALTGLLRLPPDVRLVPVGDLAEKVRRLLPAAAGDYAITRPRSRTGSRLLDADAVELLRQFASPTTVVAAVIRHSKGRGADAAATLDAAYPMLERLVQDGFLVAADGGAGAAGVEASWGEGERIAGFTVLRRAHVLEDSEVYLVRCAGAAAPGGRELALKIERPQLVGAGGAGAAGAGAGRGTAARLLREAVILAHLARRPPAVGGDGADGTERAPAFVAPLLAGAGLWQGRRFLALEWCRGIDAATAASELRAAGPAGRRRLLALCAEVAAGYAGLHRRGVLHGDVHAHNVLVNGEGRVRLIDFGLAQWCGAPAGLAATGRGGVAFYFEPEYALAALAGQPGPPPTAAGEQYGVAALLYRMAAGAHYADFSLERESLLRQIATAAPLPFAAHGAAAWPAVEAVLARALAKAPGDRFASLADFAAAWRGLAGDAAAVEAQVAVSTGGEDRGAAGGEPARLPSLAAALGRRDAGGALLAATLDRLRPGGELWAAGLASPPLASVQYGSAGIACALYRIALARQDAALLARADLWSARAIAAVTAAEADAAAGAESKGGARASRRAAAPAAFYNSRLGITPAQVGRASLFHTATGVHVVAALIANVLDDRAGRQRVAEADLALGRSGLLLGCCLLLDALGAIAPADPADLAERREAAAGGEGEIAALGDELLAGLWREIDALPPIGAGAARPNLGMAHGWAGYLYASLRWCQVRGRALPGGLGGRLGELGDAAESWGRGVRWRWLSAAAPAARRSGGAGQGHQGAAAGALLAAPAMAGWCNGSAGMVHLFALAGDLLGDRRARDLAHAAAWHAWEADSPVGTLCCGLAGRAYALLDLYQRSGDGAWFERARILAERAAAGAGAAEAGEFPDSLYRGRLGIALLVADLEQPASAAMPLFAPEGWSGPTRAREAPC